MFKKVSEFSAPTLYITSDKDCQNEATKLLYEKTKTTSAFVVFKDEFLDNSMTFTEETSIWSKGLNDAVPGLAQHFACKLLLLLLLLLACLVYIFDINYVLHCLDMYCSSSKLDSILSCIMHF